MFQNDNQFSKRPRLSDWLPYRKTEYKTELCVRYQRGTCDYGDRCCYAHGFGDLRRLDKMQEQIPVDEVSRVKYRDENQIPRWSDKSRLCWRFMNGEKCQFGDKCLFNHVKTERESIAISVLNVTGNGKMQQQKQTPWRTKLCNRWMSTGSCTYGDKCCFAHGESELQKKRSNYAQYYVENSPCQWNNKNFEKEVDGKPWEFKWKNVEKIGRVYADWINDTPLVHVEAANLTN